MLYDLAPPLFFPCSGTEDSVATGASTGGPGACPAHWSGVRQRRQRLAALARQKQGFQVALQALALSPFGEEIVEALAVALQRSGAGVAGMGLLIRVTSFAVHPKSQQMLLPTDHR